MAGKPIVEDGIVVGNVYNKYESRNPIARHLLRGFLRALDDLLARAGDGKVHEVGCGEGYLSVRMKRTGREVRGSDFSEQIIERARTIHGGVGIDFRVRSIYDLNAAEDAADTIVCCEVLEHLDQPERALARLAEVTRRSCILSVPNEPLWRLMNIARGKYWSEFGNTPGHVQKWSRRAFIRIVSQHFAVVEVRQPVPWTMVRCQPRTV